MTQTEPHILQIALIALIGAFVVSAQPAPAAEPIDVTHRVSIKNGNWIPLSVEDMQRAAVDTLLARLTDAGRLRILDLDVAKSKRTSPGELQIAIHLIGPAETAKVTITLDAPASPTLVATAAISVRGLDHRGIYQAFEHVGEESADRLTAKLDHLANLPDSHRSPTPPTDADPERRHAYAKAQTAKRTGLYAEARMGFESVVASAEQAKDGLRLLAEDELRYGLPVYEAQQAMNEMGRPGQQIDRTQLLTRAENLYRQIEAENQHDLARIGEAQRAIDSMLVVRRALGNAMRANLRARAMALKFEIAEFSMSEGRCPSEAYVKDSLARRPGKLALIGVETEPGGNLRYRIEEAANRIAIDLLCSLDGVELVDIEAPKSEPAPVP